jgi:hypothetical protein
MDLFLVKHVLRMAAAFSRANEPIRTPPARLPRRMDAVGTESVRGTCHESWGSFDRA